MKKSIKLLAVLATIASLTACENLGEKVDFDEGVRQQAHYEKNVEQYMPKAYTYDTTVSLKMSAQKVSVSTVTKGSVAFDMDAVYYHVNAKMTVSAKAQGQSASQDVAENLYVYYKDGYVYDAIDSNAGGGTTKQYTKYEMSKAEAKDYILDNYLMNTSSISGSVDEQTSKALNGTEQDLVKYYNNKYIKSKTSFYSKGEGNLSCKASLNYAATSSGVSLNFNINLTCTFEDGFLTKAKFSGKTSVQGISATISSSKSGSAKCDINYPNIATYSQVTR